MRVSTDKQDLGPKAQRSAIEAWALANGVTVVAWHLDKGISGSSEIEDRPELLRALAELKIRKAGFLIIAKRDRLARDTLVAQLIERAVRDCGGKIASADGIGNGDDAASALLRQILDSVAQYERQIIRGRIKAALRVKRDRNERVGRTMYGFRVGGDGKTLESDEKEQTVIEEARRLRAAGLTFRTVAEVLAAQGMLSRSGRVFDPKQVLRMLVAA